VKESGDADREEKKRNGAVETTAGRACNLDCLGDVGTRRINIYFGIFSAFNGRGRSAWGCD
jgi:hypothetical protein